MHIYFAHPRFKPNQVELSDKLLEIFKETQTELDGKDNYVEVNNPFDAFPAVEGTREEKARFGNIILSNNVSLMDRSDIIVAVIDDRDMGVVFELGYMHAQGKKIITISEHDFDNNIMIANSVLLHIPEVLSENGTKALKDAIKSLTKFY